jgi:predicted AAA+ superfamily ATPase
VYKNKGGCTMSKKKKFRIDDKSTEAVPMYLELSDPFGKSMDFVKLKNDDTLTIAIKENGISRAGCLIDKKQAKALRKVLKSYIKGEL